MTNAVLHIRADANPKMGIGHVMRCIALGQAFMKNGGAVHFLSNCQDSRLRRRLTDEGFNFYDINSSESDPAGLRPTLQVLRESVHPTFPGQPRERKWIVLDGYHFNTGFQRDLRKEGFYLVVMDDYNHLPRYHAHIILNQSSRSKNLVYNALQSTCQLKGFKYTLIRDEFSPGKPRPQKMSGNRILVTMGGSDPDNASLKVIESIRGMDISGMEVKIIAGPSNPHTEVLKHALTSLDEMTVVENARMPDLMDWADVAVAAAGSTCLELCRMGRPFLMVVTAENQEPLAETLHTAGAGINLGPVSSLDETVMTESLSGLILNQHLRETMVRRSAELVDGLGRQRVLEKMKNWKDDNARNHTQ